MRFMAHLLLKNFKKFQSERRQIIIAFLLIFVLISTSNVFIPDVNSQVLDKVTSQEVKALNEEIAEKNDQVKSLGDQAKEYAKLIQEKQALGNSLETELSIIENRIKKNELDIERKDAEIERTNLIIKQTDAQIGIKGEEINFQKLQLGSLLREIYRQDQRGQIEILFTNKNLSDFFGYVKRLEELQVNMQVTLAGVQDSKRELEIYEHTIEAEKAALQELLLELEIEKQKLDEEKGSQERLILDTELSESEFQKQLSEIRFQQRVADQEIRELEEAVKEKLRQTQLKNPSLNLNPGQLLWPIQNQGITTYYHDPTYPFRHIVGEHSGLDLRTLINGYPSMGVQLRAPGPGFVVKTIRNGRFTGNAIFLSHGDLMTVFYHLSEIYVEPDEFVNSGEIIGLTGGAPGHPGAGLSSGPHLHFEVRSDGIPVDPCLYLNPGC